MLKQPPLLPGLEDKDEETGLSWAGMRKAIQMLAISREHYYGYPVPDDNLRIVMAPRSPIQKMDGFRLRESTPAEEYEDGGLSVSAEETLKNLLAANLKDGETISSDELMKRVEDAITRYEFVNAWYVKKDQQYVTIWRNTKTGKVRKYWQNGRHAKKTAMLLDTIGASRNWDHAAEARAMLKLQTHITPTAFHYYFTTGTFLDMSPRSEICYMFRRLRPTLAIRFLDDGRGSKVLAALCMHSLGHYEGSFAGVMVPTDDVIAHLLLMRADERRYWASCNQHPLDEPQSGI